MQQDLVKLGRNLNAYMRKHCKTQAYIAENAKVDQATVSRFLRRPPRRITAAVQRLCNYAESLLAQAEDDGDKTAAQRALDECWSRSDIHARAVSKILNALAELCRHDSQEGVTPG
jgi:DNA-binding LacI/PurR family transcriptional regulator